MVQLRDSPPLPATRILKRHSTNSINAEDVHLKDIRKKRHFETSDSVLSSLKEESPSVFTFTEGCLRIVNYSGLMDEVSCFIPSKGVDWSTGSTSRSSDVAQFKETLVLSNQNRDLIDDFLEGNKNSTNEVSTL